MLRRKPSASPNSDRKFCPWKSFSPWKHSVLRRKACTTGTATSLQNFASELEEKDKKINKMKRILYCLVVAFQEGQLKLVTSKTAANERLALNVKIMEATQILKEDQEMGSA